MGKIAAQLTILDVFGPKNSIFVYGKNYNININF